MFYELNDENVTLGDENRRVKKLVDGCVSAISSDVQKYVEQKLIDESRHIKLEAERDGPRRSRVTAMASLAKKRENAEKMPKKLD